MSDLIVWATVSTASLAGLAVVAVTTLKGWREWLALQARALDTRREPNAPVPTARIELADLKERVRKLEAIAAGVEL